MAANPFAYAVTQVQKKAQQLFNPVGQAISRVPQQFGNYIQKTPQYQGAQMYQKAFQSPQVQNFVQQTTRQIAQKPIYNIPNSPTYGQMGNIAKDYATNRVIKPIVQASFDYNNPKATPLQKGMAFAQAGMGVFNATPGGLGYNAVVQGGAGALEAFRNKTDLSKGYAKGLTNQISLGSQGLGIKNPILAGAVDVVAGLRSFDPIPSGGFGVAALGANVKTSNRYNAPLQDALRSVRSNPDVMNPSWNKMLEFAKRELTPKELTKYQRLNSRGKLGFLNRIEQRFGNELKAFHKEQGVAYSDVKLPTQTGEITVYRGGRDMGDSRVLTPAKQNSGALFFTESEKYAKQYSRTPDQVSGLYKTNIKTDKIFDITNPSHIKQLEKHIQPEALQSIKDSTSHGAIDWATGSQYVDEIEKAGFKGAKFLERPAENITPQLDGSFKLSGKPVYSYALFDKQVPMTRASLPTQTGERVYHGTNYDKFDPTKAVSRDGQYGKGIYFASDKAVAKQYGKNTIEAVLDKDSLLKMDKPLTPQQQANLRKVMGRDEWDWSKNPTGDFVWGRLELSHKNPEEILKKAGIKGVEHSQYTTKGANKNYVIFDDSAVKPSLPTQVEGLAETPKTVRVWKNSRFGNGGGYDDIPVIRKEENITLYQGGKAGDNRQFWTPDKKYAEQFGNVKEKTGDFYRVDNGNRVTNVYVEAPTNSPQGLEGLAKEVQLSDKPYNFKYTSDEMPTTGKTITYQGKEVGGIGYGKDLNQKDAWLHNIEIDPQYRNKGIGKKAIDQFFQTSGANKVNGYAESPEAAKFFKSLGAKVDTDGNFTLSKTDFFNQSKGVQNADLSIKLPVAPQVVNGKIKMRPISAPTLETPAALSSNQELVGSGAGGGSSIKSTQEIINPQDPYFNVKRLNIDPKKQQAVKVAIEEAKPQFEEVVGKKLSNKEVVDFSNQSAKVLNKAVNREQTKQWSASMLKAREQLAKSAQDDKLTPEFLDTLINVKSQGADIARKLQSLSINADPKSVTAKQAILEAVLKVTDDSAKILEAAKGVNFNDQAQATAFYRQFVKPKAEDWLTLVRYNSMLSSPNTHLVNTSSNFQGTGLVAPIEKTVLGGIDWMRSKATGTDRRYYAGEGVQYAIGYYSNLKNASENFTKVMRGESLSGNPDIRQLPLTTKKGLARTTEHVLNYPMRLLEGMDQFFSTLTQGGVERSLAYRGSKGVNVGNIEYKAQQEAANRLFRGDIGGKDQGTLLRAIDQVTNLVFRATSNENPIVRTIARFTFPFVKTPMNVVKQMVEYSPAGILTLPGAKFKQEQLAKALMGAGVALGASQLLSSDRLTWAEPTNDKQRNAFRAAGLQPYAIKIGDKWISYAKLHPVIGFNLAMVASLNESFKNKKLSESEVETALTGLSKWWGYFADQSYIKNMGDLVASARGDLSGTARMLSNYPTQVIPFRALMSWVERIVDPYQRQADPNGSMLEKQLQLIGSQIPGIAGNVPTRNNLYGEPIKNQNRIINAMSPARVTTEVPDQKQIYDNMVEKSILTKQIKDIKDQAKQGKVVTGDATSTLNMGSDEVMKARFEASGDGAWSLGGKLYIKTDSGGVKVVDLQKTTSGNAIQQAKQSANDESQIKSTGVNAYFSTKLSELDKNTIYKALGTNAQDVEFKALASLPDEKQASVLYGLLKDRKWKQEKVDAFIKSDVLTNNVVGKMEDQGLINEAQAKDLKAYIKSTSIKLGKVSGSSKKAKKIKMPKLKAIKVKYSKLKIKIPKPKKYKSLLSKGRSNKYFK